jgi:hypothetical protein
MADATNFLKAVNRSLNDHMFACSRQLSHVNIRRAEELLLENRRIKKVRDIASEVCTGARSVQTWVHYLTPESKKVHFEIAPQRFPITQKNSRHRVQLARSRQVSFGFQK